MIKAVINETCRKYKYVGGMDVTVCIPDGEEMAGKTFNPHLGIIGGISVLGTSGIVEPMSRKALVDTIRVEINVRLSSGARILPVVPGNYGRNFTAAHPEIVVQEPIKCSNFIGETIDMAVEMGAEGILLVGNLGKMVKLAGGIMDTHSRNADARMEILAANAAVAGADIDTVRKITECISTDNVLEVLNRIDMIDKTMSVLIPKLEVHMKHRAGGVLECGAVVFSSKFGLLGITESAADLINKLGEEKEMQ